MTQLMEHVNGTQRGRIVPPLPEHTFKDSGITIRIRKVGPTTYQRIAQAIMRDMPDPPVPIVDTEVGEEANAADPDYIAACAERETERRAELSKRLLLIGILEAEFSIDDQARSDIARKRRHLDLIGAAYEDNPKLTPEENEKVFFILHIAAATGEDLGEFTSAIMRRSVPTEEAVQSQIATFQRPVPE